MKWITLAYYSYEGWWPSVFDTEEEAREDMKTRGAEILIHGTVLEGETEF